MVAIYVMCDKATKSIAKIFCLHALFGSIFLMFFWYFFQTFFTSGFAYFMSWLLLCATMRYGSRNLSFALGWLVTQKVTRAENITAILYKFSSLVSFLLITPKLQRGAYCTNGMCNTKAKGTSWLSRFFIKY